jgi:hypothetical protein
MKKKVGWEDEMIKKVKVKIEKVDDTTNQIMDEVREICHLNPDSDKDDRLYSLIHNIIKEVLC